jgi:hypothetical protein
MASALVYLADAPYLSATAPDDFQLQGGVLSGGSRYQAEADVRTRADQWCGYNHRTLIDYRVSRQSSRVFNMIGYGWTVQRVPWNLLTPVSGQGVIGYARGFDSIQCR